MGKLQINGDLLLAAGNEDRFLTFNYTGGTGYDWRIGYLGSGAGNENFLVFQSDKEGSTFYNALKFGLTTLNAEFGGTVTASSFIGNLSGNASTATKLKTARTIALTGSVTGSGSFDGSGNLSITTTTNHSHSYLPLSGGNLTGHLYLTGAVSNSSTSNTSQIVFGTSSNNHVAISSNTNAIIINPSTGSTTNQIILSLDSTSTFPNGVNYATSAGSASSVSWSGITGKPSTFTPSSHTHNYIPTNSYISTTTNAGSDAVLKIAGRVDMGCLRLTNENWTGYGTADPASSGLTAVEGRVYFKIIG